jgi:hypothetical protein
MTITQARQILTDLGYEVYGYQAMGNPRRYRADRLDLAKRYNLPIGGSFDKDALKAFVFDAVAQAGCTALPTF